MYSNLTELDEIKEQIKFLTLQNSELTSNISSLTLKKVDLQFKFHNKFFSIQKDNSSLSTIQSNLIENYDKNLHKIHFFHRLCLQNEDLDAKNHYLEQILAEKQREISRLIEFESLYPEYLKILAQKQHYHQEIIKSNQEIQAKDENLKVLKLRIFELSSELNKITDVPSSKNIPYFRDFSDIPTVTFSKASYDDFSVKDLFTSQSQPLMPKKNSQEKYSPILNKNKNIKSHISKVHEKEIFKLSQSSCSTLLLSFSLDKSFKIHDLKHKKSYRSPAKGKDWTYFYTGGDFSSDSTRILCGTSENNLEIFDINPLKLRRSLKGHKGEILDVKYLDFNEGISCSNDLSIKLWDLNTGINFFTYHPESKSRTLGVPFKIGLSCFFSGHNDGKISMFAKNMSKPLKELQVFDECGIKNLVVAPSGLYMLALGLETNRMKYLDLREMKFIEVEEKELWNNKYLNNVCFWSNEGFVIGGTLQGNLVVVDSFAKNKWKNLHDGMLRQAITCCLWNEYKKKVFSGDLDGNMIEWEVGEEDIYEL